MIENGHDWHPIHLAVEQTIMRFYKNDGVQKQGTGFKETQREYDFSFCPFDQLLI